MMSMRQYATRLACAALAAFSATVPAQEAWPARPITLMVALPPGSATDVLARIVAEAMARELKATVIVDNKAGSGGSIGADYVAKAKPDGYTLGFFHSSVLSAAAAINPRLPYDPRKDFTALGTVATNPIVLAVPTASPYKTLDDFIAAARKEPDRHTAGFIGIGSHSQFNLEMLNVAYGAKFLVVPYKGGGPLVNGLYSGELESASALSALFAAQVTAGKLRLLATASPLKEFPDVPTFASRGFKSANLEVLSVLMGPPQLPKPIADKLSQVVARLMKDPQLVQRIESVGFTARYGSPAELSKYIADETAVLTDLAKKAGIKAE